MVRELRMLFPDSRIGLICCLVVTLVACESDSVSVTSQKDGNRVSFTINENEVAIGTIDKTLSGDLGTSYSISSEAIPENVDAALFGIHPTLGELYFKNAPNYEQAGDADSNNQYLLRLLLANGANRAALDVIVNVSNVDESPSLAISNYPVFENTSDVALLQASDVHNNTSFSYTLFGDDAALFTLSNNHLMFKQAPDYELPLSKDGSNDYQLLIELQATEEKRQQPITVSVINDVELDKQFNNSGMFTTPGLSLYSMIAVTTYIDSTSGALKYLGCGTAATSGAGMTLWQLNSSGQLDTGFGGGDGIFTYNGAGGGNGGDQCFDVDIMQDSANNSQKIVVTGTSNDGTNNGGVMVVWRLNEDGTLDSSFGNGKGFFTYHNSGVSSYGRRALLLNDPNDNNALKIYVIGYDNGQTSTLTLWRLNSDGTLDTGFGAGSGRVQYGSDSLGFSIADYVDPVSAERKLLIGGWDSSTQKLWRLNLDGSLDTSFGGGSGFFSGYSMAGTAIPVVDIAMLPDPLDPTHLKIYYLAAITAISPGLDPQLWRINDDGTLDTSFGSSTQHYYSWLATDLFAYAINIYTPIPGGEAKVLMAGFTNAAGAAVFQRNLDGSVDTSFGGGSGQLSLNTGGAWAMSVLPGSQNQGFNILLGGYSGTKADNIAAMFLLHD